MKFKVCKKVVAEICTINLKLVFHHVNLEIDTLAIVLKQEHAVFSTALYMIGCVKKESLKGKKKITNYSKNY